MRKIFLLFIVGTVFFCLYKSTNIVFAQKQESNEVETRVGNPPLPPAAPGPGGRVFYCQGNPAWSGQGCLGSAGCGLTSIAMLVSSFGVSMTPPDVLAVAQQNPGWYSCGGGSTMEGAILPSSWLRDTLGFTVAPVCSGCWNLNLDLMKDYMDKGYLFIASSHTWPCANCKPGTKTVDHIVLLDGVDPGAGTVSVRDPNNCDYATGIEFGTNRVKDASTINWAYVYALKKTQ